MRLAYRRAYRASRKELINARRRRRRAADPEHREKERARRYGLSVQELRAILARQGNACGICKKSGRRLCIDHCHATNKVRGFLCHNCNIGLGNYNDDPKLTRAATAYLEASLCDGPPQGAIAIRAVAAVSRAMRAFTPVSRAMAYCVHVVRVMAAYAEPLIGRR